jgi:hypothetical protein
MALSRIVEHALDGAAQVAGRAHRRHAHEPSPAAEGAHLAGLAAQKLGHLGFEEHAVVVNHGAPPP